MSVAILNCQRVLPVNQHGIDPENCQRVLPVNQHGRDPENCQRVLPNTYFAGFMSVGGMVIYLKQIKSLEEQFIQYIWNQKLREVGKRYQKNA